jgi:hypothetical protein
MKLFEYIEQYVLLEAAIDRAIAANPILEPVLKRWFSDLKPKYFPWVINVIKDLELFHPYEDSKYLSDLRTTINDFDKFSDLNVIKNKDIGSYEDWDTVSKAVEEAKKRKEEIEIQKANKKNSTQKIYEDEQYLVMQPKNKESSCVYGKGSQWCISATQSKNYFDEYTEKGVKFVFIVNKQSNDKDAIAYHPKVSNKLEIFDVQDNERTVDWLVEKYPPQIIQIIENHIGFKIEGFNLPSFINDPILQINNHLGIPGDLEEKFEKTVPTLEQTIQIFLNVARDINRLGETDSDQIDNSDIKAMLRYFVGYILFSPIVEEFEIGNLSFSKIVEVYKGALRILEREGENFPRDLVNKLFNLLFEKGKQAFIANGLGTEEFFGLLDKAKAMPKQFNDKFANNQANMFDYIIQNYPNLDFSKAVTFEESKKKNNNHLLLSEFLKKELF